MRHATLLTLLIVLWVAGCSSSPEVVEAPEPDEFTVTMNAIAQEIGNIDRNLIGGRYSAAAAECRRAHSLVRELANFEPAGDGDRFRAYMDYSANVNDLLHSTDRLLYMLEQRRHSDAEEQLAAVAVRFNRVSALYGPSEQVGVLSQPAEAFAYHADSPDSR
jgi:hypothetical protein